MHKKADPAWQEHVQVFGLLGNPVAHSLSPVMHRAAFRAMGIRADYVAFQVVDLPSAIVGLRGLNIRGASVTIPFKEKVMDLLDEVEDVARKIGAVNTILNRDGRLIGQNTDWLGFLKAICAHAQVCGEVFLILGAGGAARAAAYGVLSAGGIPVILNRDLKRARNLAQELGCSYKPMEGLGEIEALGLINTTPVGMAPQVDESPVPRRFLGRFEVVMDVVYNPLGTRLLREAQEEGALAISGMEMFVHQGAEQIRAWTGMEPPLEVMRDVVRHHLGARDAD